MPHWGKFKRRKPMTRIFRGELPPPLLPLFPLWPIQRAILQILSTAFVYVMGESYPFFTPVLLPSVSLLSRGGRGGVVGTCMCGERKTLLVHHLYSHRCHRHHHHRSPPPPALPPRHRGARLYATMRILQI